MSCRSPDIWHYRVRGSRPTVRADARISRKGPQMTGATTSLRSSARAVLGDRRETGPIGTASRIAAGLITAAYRRLAPESLARRNAICSGPACWLIAIMIGTAVGIDVLTPASGEVALWVWLGASMLLAAVRGYGGCEVLAVPNLITGRRDQIGCLLFTPIDRAEARRRAGRLGHPAPAQH